MEADEHYAIAKLRKRPGAAMAVEIMGISGTTIGTSAVEMGQNHGKTMTEDDPLDERTEQPDKRFWMHHWIPFKVSSQEHIEHTVDGPAKSKSPVHMVVNIPLFIGFLPFYPIIYRLSTILLVVYRMGFGGTLGLDKVDKRNWRGSAAGPRCGWVPKEMDENKAQL